MSLEPDIEGPSGEFEKVYEGYPDKNPLLSVIQFTDEWLLGETIDTSFAEWALKNAKTFMSVIYPGPTSNDMNMLGKKGEMISIESMKKAGHSNIVVNPEQKILDDTFRNTATDVIDTKGDPLKAIITPEDGIAIKSANSLM